MYRKRQGDGIHSGSPANRLLSLDLGRGLLMRYDSRYRTRYSYSSFFPVGVKWLLISNVAVWLVYFFAVRMESGQFFSLLALSPRAVLGHFAIWQLVTYLFLHDPYGFGHILFNMLTLWMFGMDLERDWGTKQFLKYYFLCGIGAGICDVLANAAVGNLDTRTIGASGAIYGLLLAFGMLYPDRTVLMSFLFPIKAKYFVMIMGAIAFLSSIGSTGTSRVSNVAHLGGMIFGYIYLRTRFLRLDAGNLVRKYQAWKMQRAKKKFQVYMRKHGRGPWVN
jgi:membrane associated rhomboid family serine protease